jgi:hypothetical protein
MSKNDPVQIPEEIAARYVNPDEAERFDGAVRKVFGLSADRAAQIRREADAIPPNHRGRPKKTETSSSRVPVRVSLRTSVFSF